MAYEVTKVRGFMVALDDRIGMLAEAARALKSEGISLSALGAWSEGGGKAQVLAIAPNTDRLRELASRNGVYGSESDLLMVTGDDETGALVPVLDKIAAAGLNIRTIHAVSAGDRFGAVITFSNASADEALARLG